ncbi:RanBD1 domain-containing protein [Mycena indigotica]|uniref:RanBD1 domain-containing protein n=1 Tax=Mycena indigotica TaxID=2126181 RepID=A0A8H6W8A5_9AGAR|nr:RanBD1 domain-containing protein [Mycena indigotica]KAF7309479.1 RanBD1 domain-containing protein [Mycena indigotica]
MLPDLNVVLTGFAAFSATVGYAFARKIRPLPSRARAASVNQAQSLVDSTSAASLDAKEEAEDKPDLTEADPVSLKRKREPVHDDVPDLDYPLVCDDLPHRLILLIYSKNLYSIYPNKRRGGSVSDHDAAEENVVESVVEPIVEDPSEKAEPSATTDAEFQAVEIAQPRDEIAKPALLEADVANSFESSSSEPAATEALASEKPQNSEENPRSPTPEAVSSDAVVPRFGFTRTTASPRFVPLFPTTQRSSASSTAFSTFAGSSNPFFANAGSTTNLSTLVSSKPIWAAATSQSTAATADESDQKPNAIAAATPNACLPSTSQPPPTTGEEDESALLSLRGLTLFVKRGDAAFSSAVPGSLKLLLHKVSGNKRLLFRREPLWQVAMNTRIHGALRCTFDAREGVLRVILKESVEGDSTTLQTVIYAFKPGRTCRRSEFSAFAEALVVQAHQTGQEPVTEALSCS